MFCSKCGLKMEENETVCPSCGTEVQKGEIVTETEVSGTDSASKEKKKLGKKGIGILAGAVVCAVAVILFVVNFSMISNAVRRTITSPASYYRYVEKKNTTKAVKDAVTAMYAQSPEDWNQFYADGTMTIELNDYVLNLASALTGMENLSWLQYIGLTTAVSMQDDTMESDMAIMLGEEAMLAATPLISMQTLYDLKNEMVYMQIPELSKVYLGMKSESTEDTGVPAMQDVYALIPSAEEINTLVQRYFTMFFSHVELVEKGEDVITTQSLTKDVYTLSATIDAKAIKAALSEIMAEVKEDKIIVEFLQGLDNLGMTADVSCYEEFLAVITDAEAKLVAWDVETVSDCLLMTVYVDEKGSICGRDIRWSDANGESKVMSYVIIQDKTVLEAEAVLYGDQICRITGTGSVKKNVWNGVIVCKVNEEDFFEITLENFKVTELFQGKTSGTMKIALLDGFSNVLGLDKETAFLLAVFSNYYLQIDMKVEEKTAEYTYSLRDDSVSYVTITANSSYGTPTETPTVPTDVIIIDETSGTDAWIQTIDFEKLKEHLQTTPLPEEWISLIDLFAVQLQTTPLPE